MNANTISGHDARTRATISKMTDRAEQILLKRIAADAARLLPGEQARPFDEHLATAIASASAEEIRLDAFATFEADSANYREWVRVEWMCRHINPQTGEVS